MLFVTRQSAYQLVVVLMVLVAELAALGFEKNDDGTGVVGFPERVALDQRGLRRRRIPGDQCLCVGLGVLLDGGYEHVRHNSEQHPEHHDRQGELPGQFRPRGDASTSF